MPGSDGYLIYLYDDFARFAQASGCHTLPLQTGSSLGGSL